MKFIIGGENAWDVLERLTYNGVIGIFYNDTLSGVLSYLLVGIILVFAVIGVFAVLKRIIFGKKKKEDPGKKWLRTGKL